MQFPKDEVIDNFDISIDSFSTAHSIVFAYNLKRAKIRFRVFGTNNVRIGGKSCGNIS